MSAIQSLAREKARCNIQALLATPLAPRDIWLGKSVGVFVPGLAFAVVMTTAALVALNLIYFVPKIGFLISLGMLVSNLVAVLLVYLALTALVHEVGLVGKPSTANILTQVFLPVMITIMINLALRGVYERWFMALHHYTGRACYSNKHLCSEASLVAQCGENYPFAVVVL